jgi:hypothetical protein
MATNPEVDPAVAVDPALAAPAAFADQKATGLPGSFMDPNVTCGGASSGIGFGTNAVYASAKDCPLGDSEGKAVGVHFIGEPTDPAGRKAYAVPGDPTKILIIKEAEQEALDGASLGFWSVNGKPVLNKSGATVNEGQFVIGVGSL